MEMQRCVKVKERVGSRCLPVDDDKKKKKASGGISCLCAFVSSYKHKKLYVKIILRDYRDKLECILTYSYACCLRLIWIE